MYFKGFISLFQVTKIGCRRSNNPLFASFRDGGADQDRERDPPSAAGDDAGQVQEINEDDGGLPMALDEFGGVAY
jgi:hypothetical protein